MSNTLERIAAIEAELAELKAEVTKALETGKRWKPGHGYRYYYIDFYGDWEPCDWYNDATDKYRYSVGNCYQYDEQDLAVWEQVTRRQYECALRDAADWVKGECYHGYWRCGKLTKGLDVGEYFNIFYDTTPRFATKESCIDAHTRILGKDAKRYFTGEV
jgi:hypothetical protein